MAGPGNSWFVTLTYNPRHLPAGAGLRLRDLQLFLKRLRRWYDEPGIRYLACGEYGDTPMDNFEWTRLGRPHYHLALFGARGMRLFEDRKLWKRTTKGHALYRSADLEHAWRCQRCGETLGHSYMGSLTFQSAAYVAGYVTKKLNGNPAQTHYRRVHGGTWWSVPREFAVMSRNPGLGYEFFYKHLDEIAGQDFVRLGDGKKFALPRYYDYLLASEGIEAFTDSVKAARREAAGAREDTPETRAARDATLRAKRAMSAPHEFDPAADAGTWYLPTVDVRREHWLQRPVPVVDSL